MADNEKKTKKSDTKDKKKGGFKVWIADMKSELRKVQWPTKKQTANHTTTVLISVLLVGSFIWVFDFLASNIIEAIIRFA